MKKAHCVEAREHIDGVDMHDTQNRGTDHLGFESQEWNALVQALHP